MKNAYAKDYYNDFLKGLPTDYKSARWFSSKATRLDYEQTLRVLKYALGSQTFEDVLEIGPGDGVWTDLLIPRTERLTLLDQSVEMLNRAKDRLKDNKKISFVLSDFLAYSTEQKYDLIFAIRCFEYFEDKDVAIKKMIDLLNPGGKLVLITKNPEHIKMAEVQKQELHKGQISKLEMLDLLSDNGFTDTEVLSATWRLKARYFPMRILFQAMHKLHVFTKGTFKLPVLTRLLSESYLYVSEKK